MPAKIKKQLPASKLVSMGVTFLNQGLHRKAEEAFRQAIEVERCCIPARKYLTEFLAVSKRTAEAIHCLEQWIAMSPRDAASLYELADKASFLNQYAMARQLLNEALKLNPDRQTWLNASLLLLKIDYAENEWLTAVESANRILEVQPENLEALQVRQRSYFCLAWTPEDVADCRLYLKLKPDVARHNRLLFQMNCLPETSPELLYEESLRWNQLYAAPLASEILPHRNTKDPARRLKVGYVSPDFRHHAIMRLLPGVLENHDKEQFEIFAYSLETTWDDITGKVQHWVDHFVQLPATRNEIARRVQQDGIDILVDLAGHTMPKDALLAFAVKPAPIQLTWMGTLATTGLATMDYFLGDALMPCPGTEQFFSEEVYRLPRTHACYRPAVDAGIVRSPYFQNGYITFGSFNDPRKISRDVVKVWSVILHLHPGSGLLLKYKYLEREMAQQRLREWLREDGITADRLTFEGSGPPLNFQQAINRVDLALDPFPYTGGTTTLETLWMGVPVVSLTGRLAVSACGACLLAAVGLPVAATLEQYIALAAMMAKAIPEQPDSRRHLRASFQQSTLMDEKGMTRALETAYRDMWRAWCSGER